MQVRCRSVQSRSICLIYSNITIFQNGCSTLYSYQLINITSLSHACKKYLSSFSNLHLLGLKNRKHPVCSAQSLVVQFTVSCGGWCLDWIGVDESRMRELSRCTERQSICFGTSDEPYLQLGHLSPDERIMVGNILLAHQCWDCKSICEHVFQLGSHLLPSF